LHSYLNKARHLCCDVCGAERAADSQRRIINDDAAADTRPDGADAGNALTALGRGARLWSSEVR
jgi:hypothetical protein